MSQTNHIPPCPNCKGDMELDGADKYRCFFCGHSVAMTSKPKEEKMKVACQHEHIEFQPTDAEFVCPNCGKRSGMCVAESVNESDCGLLHKGDWVECGDCNIHWPVEDYAKAMKAKSNHIVCPTCSGSGVVDKNVVAELEKTVKNLNEYILELEQKLIDQAKGGV